MPDGTTFNVGSDTESVWLTSFLFISLCFNIVAFLEQVIVSFGIQALKWYEEQDKLLDMASSWKVALKASRATSWPLNPGPGPDPGPDLAALLLTLLCDADAVTLCDADTDADAGPDPEPDPIRWS